MLCPLIDEDFSAANARGASLTLIRPLEINFTWKKKSEREIGAERQKHADLANQFSMFDRSVQPLEPPPYRFFVRWKDARGKSRMHESDDWESAGAFFRFKREYGEFDALNILRHKYEVDYMSAGLALAFSTHSRRNATNGMLNQWLLVGLIRVDETDQADLFLGRDDIKESATPQG